MNDATPTCGVIKGFEIPALRHCIACGGLNTHEAAWVHHNTGEIDPGDGPTEEQWCPDCGEADGVRTIDLPRFCPVCHASALAYMHHRINSNSQSGEIVEYFRFEGDCPHCHTTLVATTPVPPWQRKKGD